MSLSSVISNLPVREGESLLPSTGIEQVFGSEKKTESLNSTE